MRKTFGLLIANIIALGLFGLGLVAGLTPSYGLPRIQDIVVFAILPITILTGCWRAAINRNAKLAFIAQIIVLCGVTCWLMLFLYKTS